MDLGSPDQRSDEMNDLQKEDESTFVGKLDLNLAVNKEEVFEGYDHENEAWGGRTQMDLNQQGQHGSSLSLPADIRCEMMESPVQTELDHGDTGEINFDDDQERLRSPLMDNHYEDKTHVVCGRDFVKLSSPVDTEVFNGETGAEDSARYLRKSPLTMDTSYRGEGVEKNNSDLHRLNSYPFDGNLKEDSGNFSENVKEEEEVGGTDHHTGKSSSPVRMQYSGDEIMKREFYCRKLPPENEKLELHHSGLHSPERSRKRSASPIRRMSASPERSPYIQQSPGLKPSSSPKGVQDPSYSSKSSRQKHSSSERPGGDGKRVSSRDHLSPARRNSASPRRQSRQESRRRDESPQKRLSTSPRRRYSPSDRQRQNRSASRSPTIRRKDSSSGYRRDYRDRSRSRSPYARDRYKRSPRRRYSPRRRSPSSGYQSRHHSSRRRPWSPPPNRSNGVGRPGSNLFIAGFNFVTTEKDLERKFSRFGRVKDVRIVRDRRSGDSRGFGFLSLERDEDADAAIRALDQTEWNGRVVLVEKSKTPTH